ncbi:hypothetical protein EVAR_59124_1 [Eumeta japonica]|uniref:Uncharacterized protein n=1 Tax=Eumeta variegata TaxID=151549 RepID=A0A4C1ZHF3_EUMVA|nr:hypothetical protein EVAR_59124_1 [Eumeta japonica]
MQFLIDDRSLDRTFRATLVTDHALSRQILSTNYCAPLFHTAAEFEPCLELYFSCTTTTTNALLTYRKARQVNVGDEWCSIPVNPFEPTFNTLDEGSYWKNIFEGRRWAACCMLLHSAGEGLIMNLLKATPYRIEYLFYQPEMCSLSIASLRGRRPGRAAE